MGREVRMVPADWKHPVRWNGFRECWSPIPLIGGRSYEQDVAEWRQGKAKWSEGLRDDFQGGWIPVPNEFRHLAYEEWTSPEPKPESYMPKFPEGTATHFMMYETTSEGTPISPAFATPEELARWLADNNASAFGSMTADYDSWLATIKRGWAMSAVVDNGRMVSGVEYGGSEAKFENEKSDPPLKRFANLDIDD